MRITTFMAILWLALLSGGCAVFLSKESRYLKSAQDHAIQEEVRQRLGEPRSVSSTEDGSVVWVYEVHDIEPMSQSSWSTLGSWCDEYQIIFDKDGVVRHWGHRSFLHGGELMPKSCTAGVEKPAL
jgi:hypothetical protein